MKLRALQKGKLALTAVFSLLVCSMTGCCASMPAANIAEVKAGHKHDQAEPKTKVKKACVGKKLDLANAPKLSRSDFNRIARLLDSCLFWQADKNKNSTPDPDEMVVIGYEHKRSDFMDGAGFTPRFREVQRAIIDAKRLESLRQELNQGRPTLVHTKFSSFKKNEKQLVREIIAAAAIIEDLFAMQNGSYDLRSCLAGQKSVSKAVFDRNQGPWCQAPNSEDDPFCNACPHFPEKRSGLYPPALQKKPHFCEHIAKQDNAKQLFDPFHIVVQAGEALKAVAYTEVYEKRMNEIAAHLEKAAAFLPKGEEQAFRAYLKAAAQSFRDNNWEPADEAWAAMNASNSKWYLRIGPDEVYYEPCNRKAGFHTSFALIDEDSLYWQEKLTPLRQDMENDLAALIGDAYAARKVHVHMPDFIEIILNAGDARSPLGATIGQSLPNWGKVAVEGRGRTVVMTNLYTDPDSRNIRRAQAESLLSADSMTAYTEEKRLATLDIILHEITHNFGPHSDYVIHGKRPGDVFGGAVATILEELKAQTGALYFVDFLHKKGLLTEQQAHQVYNHAIVWCFGHISRGMFTAAGKPKPYSQLAGIQVGYFMQQGAMEWQADKMAANGKDKGRFVVHYDKLAKAVAQLMKTVGHIKAKGDVAQAKKLIGTYMQGPAAALYHHKQVKQRLLRFPKASFVYALDFK